MYPTILFLLGLSDGFRYIRNVRKMSLLDHVLVVAMEECFCCAAIYALELLGASGLWASLIWAMIHLNNMWLSGLFWIFIELSPFSMHWFRVEHGFFWAFAQHMLHNMIPFGYSWWTQEPERLPQITPPKHIRRMYRNWRGKRRGDYFWCGAWITRDGRRWSHTICRLEPSQ